MRFTASRGLSAHHTFVACRHLDGVGIPPASAAERRISATVPEGRLGGKKPSPKPSGRGRAAAFECPPDHDRDRSLVRLRVRVHRSEAHEVTVE